MEPIDFYFDFSSPYAYLAAQGIDRIGERHGRPVRWRPYLMGAVFKRTGARPLVDQDMKGPYARHDLARSARRLGVPFRLPDDFPFMSVAACRAFYWLVDDDPEAAKALAKALFHKAFAEGSAVGAPAAVQAVAADLGHDPERVAAALADPAVKDRLRAEVEAALAAGVFGSPFFVVDGEPFWGHDRMDHLDQWLASGGW